MNRVGKTVPRLKIVSLLILIIFYLFAVLHLSSLSADEGEPRAFIHESFYNFGAVMKGEKVTHAFTVKNAGTGDLIIRNIEITELFTTIRFEKFIPPGQEG